MADIPGLIEGASDGAGLGHAFLRHVERVRLIVHIVDISGIEGRDPVEDYNIIQTELKNYSEMLYNLPQIVCVNKCDMLEDDSAIKDFEKAIGKKVIKLSAITKKGTDELLDRIVEELKVLPKQEPIHIEAVDDTKDRTSFEVMRDSDGAFEVVGGLVDNLVRNVVLSDFESNRYFQKMLVERGVIKALKESGCEEGDIVRMSDIEFEFVE